MRAVDIVGPDGDEGQLEATSICAHHHLCGCLTCGIWICRRQDARLAQICCSNRHISIHLIRGDVYEPANAMLARAFEQHVCPVYVCVGETVRVAEAKIDVRLSSEVEDGVDLVRAKDTLHVGRRCDVAILECKVRLAIEYARVVQSCAVVELIERDDVVVPRVSEH